MEVEAKKLIMEAYEEVFDGKIPEKKRNKGENKKSVVSSGIILRLEKVILLSLKSVNQRI